MLSPTTKLVLDELATAAETDPDALCEAVYYLADALQHAKLRRRPFARAAERLAPLLATAALEYAKVADQIAEDLVEPAQEEMPLMVAAE